MRIIYVIFAPLSYNYFRFLNIENLSLNGFDVTILDISEIFYSKDQINKYYEGTKEFYKPKLSNEIKIDNYKDYKNFFLNFSIKNTIIYYTGRGFYKRYKEKKFFDHLYSLNFKIFVSEFSQEFFPTNIKEKIKLNFFILKNRFLSNKYRNLNFIGCGQNIEEISKKIYLDLNYFSVPHPNYIWGKNDRDENYALYVEESFDGAPDHRVRNVSGKQYKGFKLGDNDFVGKYEDTSKKFYFKLNSFFSNFEKIFNTKIKIAASGKNIYDQNRFNQREIIYGDTINLISSANYVIGHSSMALWQSIISNKKLILLSDNTLELYKLAEIRSFSKKSNTNILNLSNVENFNSDIFKNNSEVNKKTTNFFLNNSTYQKSYDQIMIEIFLKAFKNIN